MYNMTVKKKELEKILKSLGWWQARQGGEHEIWTNGEHMVAVPRHREIGEFTAKGIIKKVRSNPAER